MQTSYGTLCTITLAALLSATSVSLAGTRFFTSLSGTTLEAEIADASSNAVTLRKVIDGTTVVIPVATLCGEDKKYIAHWLKSEPSGGKTPGTSIDKTPPISTNSRVEKNTLPPTDNGGKYSLLISAGAKKSDRSAGAFTDTRSIKLVLTVQVENREVKRDLIGAKLTLIALARSIEDPSDFKVVIHEEMPVSVVAQKKFSQDSKEVRLEYDDQNTYRYGFKYYGHILVLKDNKGSIIETESTPTGMTKNAESALALKIEQIVDRQLMPKKVSRVIR